MCLYVHISVRVVHVWLQTAEKLSDYLISRPVLCQLTF